MSSGRSRVHATCIASAVRTNLLTHDQTRSPVPSVHRSRFGTRQCTYAHQIHLHLTPYPVPTPEGVFKYACAAAKLFEAKLSGSSSRLAIRAPPNWIIGAMMSSMARELEGPSTTATTKALEAHLLREAASLGVPAQLTPTAEHWPGGFAPRQFMARPGQRSLHCWACRRTAPSPVSMLRIGSSARAVPVSCTLTAPNRLFSTENILVCWDFSRSAARIVSDALPLASQCQVHPG